MGFFICVVVRVTLACMVVTFQVAIFYTMLILKTLGVLIICLPVQFPSFGFLGLAKGGICGLAQGEESRWSRTVLLENSAV